LNIILKEILVVTLGYCGDGSDSGDSGGSSPSNDSGLGPTPNVAGELGTHLFIQEFFHGIE